MHSIVLRSQLAWRRTSSIKANAFVPPGCDVFASKMRSVDEVSSIAALRCSDENSSAKIFIADAALGFVQPLNLDVAVREFEWGRWCCKPPLDPFDDRDAIPVIEILLQTGADYLGRRIQTIQVEMMQRQASGVVASDQRECGRLDAIRDSQSLCDSFNQLGLARAEVAGESDDPAALGLAAPLRSQTAGLLGGARFDHVQTHLHQRNTLSMSKNREIN